MSSLFCCFVRFQLISILNSFHFKNLITLSRRNGNTTGQSKLPPFQPFSEWVERVILANAHWSIHTPPTTKQTEIVLVEYSRRLSNRATNELINMACMVGVVFYPTRRERIIQNTANVYSLFPFINKSNQNPTRKREIAGISQPCFLIKIKPFLRPEWVKISFQLIQTGLFSFSLLSSIDQSINWSTPTTKFHHFTPLHKYFMTFSTWKEWRRCNPSSKWSQMYHFPLSILHHPWFLYSHKVE